MACENVLVTLSFLALLSTPFTTLNDRPQVFELLIWTIWLVAIFISLNIGIFQAQNASAREHHGWFKQDPYFKQDYYLLPPYCPFGIQLPFTYFMKRLWLKLRVFLYFWTIGTACYIFLMLAVAKSFGYRDEMKRRVVLGDISLVDGVVLAGFAVLSLGVWVKYCRGKKKARDEEKCEREEMLRIEAEWEERESWRYNTDRRRERIPQIN